jgi:hypothetical protein
VGGSYVHSYQDTTKVIGRTSDVSLTGVDIVEPLSVNQQRTGTQTTDHQMQDGLEASSKATSDANA